MAVHDARYPAAGPLWRERAHDGECRSVDLCPAARSVLSAGLDGTCRVACAQAKWGAAGDASAKASGEASGEASEGFVW